MNQRPPAWAIRTKADRKAVELGYYWDEDAAQRIIDFAAKYFRPQFVKGWKGLLPWQERFLRSLYGWKSPDGNRRWRKATLHCAKKAGKTLILALCCLYELVAAGHKSAVVNSASTTAINAGQIFKEVAYQIRNNPNLKKLFRITAHQKLAYSEKLNATFRSMSGDSGTAEGGADGPPVFTAADELAWHRDFKLYDAIVYNSVERPDGLFVSISTAGKATDHPYHNLYSKAKRILSGDDLDVSVYAEVHEADPDSDFEDKDFETAAKAANPSLGSTHVTLASFRADMETAKSEGFGSWQNFKLRRLNIWCNASQLTWLQPHAWEACRVAQIHDDELKQYPCGFGLDWSEVEDPSSVSLCWQLPGGRYYLRSYGWVCTQGYQKREASLKTKYDDFIGEGSMTETPGSMIDADGIREWVLDMAAKFRPVKMLFDATAAHVAMMPIRAFGYDAERWPQTHRYFNEPMKQFEALVKSRLLSHEGKKYAAWGINNVRVDVNKDGQCRPDSGRSVDHIDSAVSALMAFGAVFAGQQENPPITESPVTFVQVKRTAPAVLRRFWQDRSWC